MTKAAMPSRVIQAVANGDVDLAMAWGPLAGYFAQRQAVALTLSPVEPATDSSGQRFVFELAIAVKRSEKALRGYGR